VSDRNEKYRQKFIASVSAHIGEPALGVGIFSRPGSMSSMLTTKVSPLAGAIMSKANKGKTGGLPLNVVVGVTATKVYVFPYKPKGTGLKLKDPVAIWDRDRVTVERLKEGAMATRLRFHIPDSEPIELDSNAMPGGGADFNAPVVELLSP
jgi:hypothetical protein